MRTIEGFDDDSVMAELREAFSAKHALQCGYCTPGMLVTARDIVLRLPDADEPRIRKELAGNLCRCTGYVGIVQAIQSVIEERKVKGLLSPSTDPSSFDSAALRSRETASLREAVAPKQSREHPRSSSPLQIRPRCESSDERAPSIT